ncbi:hypothetical protein [Castellaniella sp.]|nr:hypothetical protein [Castellaniella sp.]
MTGATRADRVTGNRCDGVDGAGREFVFVAIDDHARVACTGTRFQAQA